MSVSANEKPTLAGRYRLCRRTNTGRTYYTEPEGAADLPVLKKDADEKNTTEAGIATHWVEEYESETRRWKPIYPQPEPQ